MNRPIETRGDIGRHLSTGLEAGFAHALDTAISSGHSTIGTGDVLVGILREEGRSQRVLADLGIELTKTQEVVEAMFGPHRKPLVTNPEFTPGVRRVIDLAVNEAEELRDSEVAEKHFILALTRRDMVMGEVIFEQMGVNSRRVHHELLTH